MPIYVAVVACAHCGTNFKVNWNGTETGSGHYQCPNCHNSMRVEWGLGGFERADKI